MSGDLSSLVEDEDVVSEDVLADVRRKVRKQFRFCVVAVGVVCLIVGGLIGTFGGRERLSRGTVELMPPPYWETVRGPDEVDVAVDVLATVTPPLNVYVAGAVARPGVVTVHAGSLLADALRAVGGATSDAALENVNLAAPLTDNQHIVIPERVTDAVVADASAAVVEGVVNINTATQTELETLPHIGPALAQRIIDYREENGPFPAKIDIQNVSGIGATRYADIEALITVDVEP